MWGNGGFKDKDLWLFKALNGHGSYKYTLVQYLKQPGAAVIQLSLVFTDSDREITEPVSAALWSHRREHNPRVDITSDKPSV